MTSPNPRAITKNAAARAFEEVMLAFARDDDGRASILDAFPTADTLPLDMAAVYGAALALYDADKPIIPALIATALGTQTDLYTYLENGQPYAGQELLEQIDILREVSEDYVGRSLLAQAKHIQTTQGTQAMILWLITKATEATTIHFEKRDPGGEYIVAEADAQQGAERKPGLMSGLAFLDGLTNGLVAGDGATLGGIYKGRKSTTKRNMALAYLAQGHRVALFEYEANRVEVLFDFYAMIANLYLRATGQESLATLTRRYMMQTAHWKREHWEAYQVARRVMLDYSADHRLVIFDRKDNIRDQFRVAMKIKRCSLLWGTQVVFIDGGTNIDWRDAATGKTISESEDRARSGAAGDFLAETADQCDVALVMLWQYRESENTFAQGAGLMGGSALASDADFLMESKYDEDKDDQHILFKMRRSRHSAAGWKSESKVLIDVKSGVMLGYYAHTDPNTFDPTLRPLWVVPRDVLLRDWQGAPAGTQVTLVSDDLALLDVGRD